MPFVIDEIGNEIDFIILDTAHTLPGEVLDFLVALPYLNNNAVVVLHDVAENQNFQKQNQHATGALFSAVVADKFLNFLPDYGDVRYRYPNIAAFQINEHTRENIENVFLTLILRWQYMPSREQLDAYRAIYQRHYPRELCDIFQETVKANLLNMMIAAEMQRAAQAQK